MKEFIIPCEKNGNCPLLVQPKRVAFYSSFFVVIKLLVVTTILLLPMEVYLSSGSFTDFENQIILETNDLRENASLNPFLENKLIHRSAQAKNKDMNDLGYFSHRSVDEKNVSSFLNTAGYYHRLAGENLAMGFTNAQAVVEAWHASPLHNQNMLESQFSETGVSVEQGIYHGKAVLFVVAHYAEPKIFINTPLPEQALISFDPNRSTIWWEDLPHNQTRVSASIQVTGDVRNVQAHITGAAITLEPSHNNKSIYEGSLILNQTSDELFEVVISPAVEITSYNGIRAVYPLEWEQIKIVGPNWVDKYLGASFISHFPTELLLLYSRTIFALFGGIFLLVFSFNVLHKEHARHVRRHSLLMVLLLSGLFIF